MKSIYSVKVKKSQVFTKEGQNEQRIKVAWEEVSPPVAIGTERAESRVTKVRMNFTSLQVPR